MGNMENYPKIINFSYKGKCYILPPLYCEEDILNKIYELNSDNGKRFYEVLEDNLSNTFWCDEKWSNGFELEEKIGNLNPEDIKSAKAKTYCELFVHGYQILFGNKIGN